MAKVSFVLEMTLPLNSDVVCLDTHILSLYGRSDPKNTPNPPEYHRIEDHWCRTCDRLGLSPVMARHHYWDSIRGECSTAYWSHVFEKQCNAHTGQHQAG